MRHKYSLLIQLYLMKFYQNLHSKLKTEKSQSTDLYIFLIPIRRLRPSSHIEIWKCIN